MHLNVFFSPNSPSRVIGYHVILVVCQSGLFAFGVVILFGNAKFILL
jgi:hypothetical protein